MHIQAAILIGILACGATLAAQAGQTTMNGASHHERLTYLRHMRVFEVNVPEGATTTEYVRDHDVAEIPLTDAAVRSRPASGPVGAPVARTRGIADMRLYTGSPETLRTENVGPTGYRAFVVENLRESDWTPPMPIVAPGTTLRQQARSFAVYDIRLTAATPRTTHVHQNPSFVFLMSGAVQVQGGGGESEFRLEQTGRWFPSSGPDQPHTLMLVGADEAHVICVEAR